MNELWCRNGLSRHGDRVLETVDVGEDRVVLDCGCGEGDILVFQKTGQGLAEGTL
jgi:hypothetical protein